VLVIKYKHETQWGVKLLSRSVLIVTCLLNIHYITIRLNETPAGFQERLCLLVPYPLFPLLIYIALVSSTKSLQRSTVVAQHHNGKWQGPHREYRKSGRVHSSHSSRLVKSTKPFRCVMLRQKYTTFPEYTNKQEISGNLPGSQKKLI